MKNARYVFITHNISCQFEMDLQIIVKFEIMSEKYSKTLSHLRIERDCLDIKQLKKQKYK